MATRESRRGSASLRSSCRSMDWLARDGLRADQHERYAQPRYEPWAICSLESRSTYSARPAHDDLPSSGVCVTRVRLSFECSRLRWRQVLVDRSAAANDTRGFASCWRPIRFPDRQREPEISMPAVTKRDFDAFRSAIWRARFRATARDRLDRGGIAGISVSVAKLESETPWRAGKWAGIRRTRQSACGRRRMAKPHPVSRRTFRPNRAVARSAPGRSRARPAPGPGTARDPRPSAGR